MAYKKNSLGAAETRDDGDSVGMIGAVVGVDQVYCNCFYISREEITGRTL